MATGDPFSSPLSTGSLAFPSSPQSGFFGLVKETPLPGQFGAAVSEVPQLTSSADLLRQYGSSLTTQGGEALAMAQRGELTAPQRAELGQYETGLTNQARQQYYSMGLNPDQTTSFLGTTADIDAKVNAMAQKDIQSTIALGLGEISSGSSFFGQSLGFDQAAINTLVTAGQAQLQQDQAFQKSLGDAWGSIGKLFGSVAGSLLGGPIGGSLGGSLSSLFGGGDVAPSSVGGIDQGQLAYGSGGQVIPAYAYEEGG